MFSEISPPSDVAGMKKLDREKFVKDVVIPHFITEKSSVSKAISLLKPLFLKLRNFKPVTEAVCDSPGKEQKKIFLDPKKFDACTDIRQRINAADVRGVFGESIVRLTYSNWNKDEILKAVLPTGMEHISSFSSIGHIVHVNLRDDLLPYKLLIGEVLLDQVVNARSVVNKKSGISSVYRNFEMELLAGEEDTVVTVSESGCRFSFDFAKVYWNPRLSTERDRILKVLTRGDILMDVFAGVGPFAIPAAKKCEVHANDLNPASYDSLKTNLLLNKVECSTYNMDGHEFIALHCAAVIRRHWKALLGVPPCDRQQPSKLHVLMNLPAIAVTFLSSFVGLMNNCGIHCKQINDLFLPIVHVYCFLKESENIQSDAVKLVESHLGRPLRKTYIQEVVLVRDVSHSKMMVRNQPIRAGLLPAPAGARPGFSKTENLPETQSTTTYGFQRNYGSSQASHDLGNPPLSQNSVDNRMQMTGNSPSGVPKQGNFGGATSSQGGFGGNPPPPPPPSVAPVGYTGYSYSGNPPSSAVNQNVPGRQPVAPGPTQNTGYTGYGYSSNPPSSAVNQSTQVRQQISGASQNHAFNNTQQGKNFPGPPMNQAFPGSSQNQRFPGAQQRFPGPPSVQTFSGVPQTPRYPDANHYPTHSSQNQNRPAELHNQGYFGPPQNFGYPSAPSNQGFSNVVPGAAQNRTFPGTHPNPNYTGGSTSSIPVPHPSSGQNAVPPSSLLMFNKPPPPPPEPHPNVDMEIEAETGSDRCETPESQLDESEKLFRKEAQEWQKGYDDWKEQNKNHPDKELYKKYEAQWNCLGDRLKEHRASLRANRLKNRAQAQALAKIALEQRPPSPPEPFPENTEDDVKTSETSGSFWSRQNQDRPADPSSVLPLLSPSKVAQKPPESHLRIDPPRDEIIPTIELEDVEEEPEPPRPSQSKFSSDLPNTTDLKAILDKIQGKNQSDGPNEPTPESKKSLLPTPQVPSKKNSMPQVSESRRGNLEIPSRNQEQTQEDYLFERRDSVERVCETELVPDEIMHEEMHEEMQWRNEMARRKLESQADELFQNPMPAQLGRAGNLRETIEIERRMDEDELELQTPAEIALTPFKNSPWFLSHHYEWLDHVSIHEPDPIIRETHVHVLDDEVEELLQKQAKPDVRAVEIVDEEEEDFDMRFSDSPWLPLHLEGLDHPSYSSKEKRLELGGKGPDWYDSPWRELHTEDLDYPYESEFQRLKRKAAEPLPFKPISFDDSYDIDALMIDRRPKIGAKNEKKGEKSTPLAEPMAEACQVWDDDAEEFVECHNYTDRSYEASRNYRRSPRRERIMMSRSPPPVTRGVVKTVEKEARGGRGAVTEVESDLIGFVTMMNVVDGAEIPVLIEKWEEGSMQFTTGTWKESLATTGVVNSVHGIGIAVLLFGIRTKVSTKTAINVDLMIENPASVELIENVDSLKYRRPAFVAKRHQSRSPPWEEHRSKKKSPPSSNNPQNDWFATAFAELDSDIPPPPKLYGNNASDIATIEDDGFEEYAPPPPPSLKENRAVKDNTDGVLMNKSPQVCERRAVPVRREPNVDVDTLLFPPGRNSRPDLIVIFIRGTPGAGKSHIAKLIKEKETEYGSSAPRIFGLDDYFLVESEQFIADASGRRVKTRVMKYEYDADMEENYRQSLIKVFKKTIDDGHFSFIIVDSIHDKVRHFEEMASYAQLKGFQIYVIEMYADAEVCHQRNLHDRTLKEIEDMLNGWEVTPTTYNVLGIERLFQDPIEEVEMKDEMEEIPEAPTGRQLEEDFDEGESSGSYVMSKWEKMEMSDETLDKLDCMRMKKKNEEIDTAEEWLKMHADDRGSDKQVKRVRWKDIETITEQTRMREIGFVVGQNNWQDLNDPGFAKSALVQVKYFDRDS
ncbi:unnamed protein product [Notodromas monacha]|uniref:tRNA (guanine(37)-N1)-methyltransferase n=1 Tax=Notodromas monacha TaxID=399045 RepID=A0A7R9GAM9_9CRUS|nr:unnamed protein product [Notodromas monacha]CAG0914195.1 unnamed protein product [Notodromas monacha]